MCVDINLGSRADEKRFIDLYTIIHNNVDGQANNFKDRIIAQIDTYFSALLEAIKTNDIKKIQYLAKYVHEAKYTGLGYSETGPGKGFGECKFKKLVESISKSEAYKTGEIEDILDIELFIKGIGVDMISDLVTNLIQDVLGEYTIKILNNLRKGDKLIKVMTNYWDENKKRWDKKEIYMLRYKEEKEYTYLLVPINYTCKDDQKNKLVSRIFDEVVYELYKEKILKDRNKYEKYISNTKKEVKVYKKDVTQLIEEELGKEYVKKGNGYLTAKGVLGLVRKYPQIKKYIEENIKK